MSSVAHQTRLMGTSAQQGWAFSIPKANLYCLTCGWTGDRTTVFHTPDGNSLQCPTCRDRGKLEPPSSIADKRHMIAISSREGIEERRKARKKINIAPREWLLEMEQEILRAKASRSRGDQQ